MTAHFESRATSLMGVLLLVFLILFTACSKEEQGLLLKDLSIYDTVSKKSIYLNMKKAEIENLLGQPKQADGNKSDYGDLVVQYKDNIVVNMVLRKAEDSQGRYTFYSNKIKIDDLKTMVEEKMGKGALALTGGEPDFYINYCYVRKGNTLDKLNQMPAITPQTKEQYYYATVYLSDDKQKVKSINLIDGVRMLSTK